MNTLMMVEVSLSVIVSLIALGLSTYSVMQAKKRGENADLKEVTTTLATLVTKTGAIERAVLGTPTLSEQVAVNTQKIADHERRINMLEKFKFKEGDCK